MMFRQLNPPSVSQAGLVALCKFGGTSAGWGPTAAGVHSSALGWWVSETFVSWFLTSFLEISGASASWINAANPVLWPSLSQPHVFENYWETSFSIRRPKTLILQATLDLVTKCCQYPKEAKTYRSKLRWASWDACKSTELFPGLYAKFLLAEFWVSIQLSPLLSVPSQAGLPKCNIPPWAPDMSEISPNMHPDSLSPMVRRHQENTQGLAKY